jgi:hypothetical protein
MRQTLIPVLAFGLLALAPGAEGARAGEDGGGGQTGEGREAQGGLKVFVLAGQSNMVGARCRAEELPKELQGEQPAALVFTPKGWVPLKPGITEAKGFGPEISFGAQMSKSLGEPIGIVKVSKGGTNLAEQWAPNRKNSLYAKLREAVKAAAKSRKIEVVGMVWMQGGADARDPDMTKAYQGNLENLIKTARKDFGNPDMAFVCGRSAAPEKKYANIAAVRAAQEGIGLPGYAWVDHDRIPMGSDGVHYSTEGQVQAGRIFAEAMLRLLKAGAPAAPPAGTREGGASEEG